MDLDQIESKIMDGLCDFCNTAYLEGLSDGGWTVGIKELLAKIGLEFGFKTCASSDKGHEPEWLFDLLWYKSDSNSHITEIGLVVESEWIMDDDELIYDFEKLLLAKSTNKLFIFQAWGIDEIERITKHLVGHIDAFKAKLSPEKYLFAALDTSNKKFEFRHKIC